MAVTKSWHGEIAGTDSRKEEMALGRLWGRGGGAEGC